MFFRFHSSHLLNNLLPTTSALSCNSSFLCWITPMSIKMCYYFSKLKKHTNNAKISFFTQLLSPPLLHSFLVRKMQIKTSVEKKNLSWVFFSFYIGKYQIFVAYSIEKACEKNLLYVAGRNVKWVFYIPNFCVGKSNNVYQTTDDLLFNTLSQRISSRDWREIAACTKWHHIYLLLN